MGEATFPHAPFFEVTKDAFSKSNRTTLPRSIRAVSRRNRGAGTAVCAERLPVNRKDNKVLKFGSMFLGPFCEPLGQPKTRPPSASELSKRWANGGRHRVAEVIAFRSATGRTAIQRPRDLPGPKPRPRGEPPRHVPHGVRAFAELTAITSPVVADRMLVRPIQYGRGGAFGHRGSLLRERPSPRSPHQILPPSDSMPPPGANPAAPHPADFGWLPEFRSPWVTVPASEFPPGIRQSPDDRGSKGRRHVVQSGILLDHRAEAPRRPFPTLQNRS